MFASPLSLALMYAGRLARERWQHRHDAPHRMRRLPRTQMRDVTSGAVVRLVGRVEVDEGAPLLRAPLSGRPCVAYRVEVTHRVQNEGRPILAEDGGQMAFTLRDDSGRAQIEASSGRPWLASKQLTASDRVPPEVLREFVRLHRRTSEGPDLRFTEGVLAVGARVAVMGRVRLDPARAGEGSASGYREGGGHPIVEADDEEGVLVSNLPLVLR